MPRDEVLRVASDGELHVLQAKRAETGEAQFPELVSEVEDADVVGEAQRERLEVRETRRGARLEQEATGHRILEKRLAGGEHARGQGRRAELRPCFRPREVDVEERQVRAQCEERRAVVLLEVDGGQAGEG